MLFFNSFSRFFGKVMDVVLDVMYVVCSAMVLCLGAMFFYGIYLAI